MGRGAEEDALRDSVQGGGVGEGKEEIFRDSWEEIDSADGTGEDNLEIRCFSLESFKFTNSSSSSSPVEISADHSISKFSAMASKYRSHSPLSG